MVGMNHSLRGILLLVSLWGGLIDLRADDELVDTFHLSEPIMADPGGSGWSVDPNEGRLSVTIPIGMMPGEISFPVSLVMTATPVTRTKKVVIGYTEGKNADRPVYGYSTDTIPVDCKVNLPAIHSALTGNQFVLEDGRVYTSSDFIKTAQSLSDHTSNPAQLFSAYGFTQPSAELMTFLSNTARFKFGWSVSSDGKVVITERVPSNVQYDNIIQNIMPSQATCRIILESCKNSFNKTSITTSGTFMVLDKNRARIFACLSYKNPDMQECGGGRENDGCSTTYTGDSGKIYLPILILDRFGHYVTLQWSAYRRDGSLLQHSTYLRRVDVRNQRGQGFTIRMNNHSDDQARLDFVGVSGPSVLISGTGPSPYWVHHDPSTSFPKPEPKSTWGPGSVGRPTTVTLGSPGSVPQPSWSNALGAPSAPPDTLSLDSIVDNRTWSLTYDSNSGALASLQDYRGVNSLFSTQDYRITQPENSYETSGGFVTSGFSGSDVKIPDTIVGVSQIDLTATGGGTTVTRQLTWNRTHTGSQGMFVKHMDVYGPETNQADRRITYSYINPIAFNPTDFGNGFLFHRGIGPNTEGAAELESIDRTSSTVRTSDTNSKGSGLNGFLSALKKFSLRRSGELSVSTVYDCYDETALQPRTISKSLNEGTSLIVSRSFVYNNCWGMMEPQQASQVSTTRYSSQGAALATTTTANQWDTNSLPLLQLQKTFLDNAGLQHGTEYT